MSEDKDYFGMLTVCTRCGGSTVDPEPPIPGVDDNSCLECGGAGVLGPKGEKVDL